MAAPRYAVGEQVLLLAGGVGEIVSIQPSSDPDALSHLYTVKVQGLAVDQWLRETHLAPIGPVAGELRKKIFDLIYQWDEVQDCTDTGTLGLTTRDAERLTDALMFLVSLAVDLSFPMTLDQVNKTVEHMLGDPRYESIFLANDLNMAMGASARRRAAREVHKP